MNIRDIIITRAESIYTKGGDIAEGPL